jgi:hypothetical protein
MENPDLSYFVKYYGGDGNQFGVDMELLNDGTFLLVGNYAQSDLDVDLYLLRVNSMGEVIWEKRIGENESSIWNVKDIEPTNDGNFVIVADFQIGGGAQRDMKLLKVTADGNILGSVDFGTPANDYSRSVTPLADGGFIVSGTTEFTSTFGLVNVTDPDLGDFINYRFDQTLTQFSINDWGPISPGFGGRQDVAVKAIERFVINANNEQDTVYQVFGHSNIDLSNTNPNRRLGLLYFKRTSDGKGVDPFFPGNFPDQVQIQYAQPMAPVMGSGIVLIGTSTDNFNQSKVFLTILRSSLTYDAVYYNNISLNINSTNGRNIRGVSAASSTVSEVGFLILANEVRTTGATNFWLSKVNQSGELLWSTTFGSEGEDDTGSAVRELPDGRIVVLGTVGLATNQSKMAFIKVNSGGKLAK